MIPRSIREGISAVVPYISDFGIVDRISATITIHSNTPFKRFTVGKDPSLAIFLPWRTSHLFAYRAGLLPSDMSYVAYTMPSGIVSPDPEDSLATMETIRDDVLDLSDSIQHLVCYSVGQFPGVAAANNMNIDRLTVVAPGTKLGACLWTGIATQHVRQLSEHQGYDRITYDTVIGDANPVENVDSLPPQISLHIGSYDRYIRPRFGEQFAQRLEQEGYSPSIVYHERSGHVFTVMHAARRLFN